MDTNDHWVTVTWGHRQEATITTIPTRKLIPTVGIIIVKCNYTNKGVQTDYGSRLS